MDEISVQDLIAMAQVKIDLGLKLAQNLSEIDVDGVKKVARKIKQEITTLQNVSSLTSAQRSSMLTLSCISESQGPVYSTQQHHVLESDAL